MSCGQIALNRLGIPIKKYYASEIDPYPIKVTQANYPDTIQLGDVRDISLESLPEKPDIILAGSPCTGFSFAGKRLAFDDPQSVLFFEFVRLLKEIEPEWFLLENVKMKKEYLNVITEQVGVEPILLNSALVSAQNRWRYYWTNIPGINEPKDRGIVLREILETEIGKEHFYKQKSIDYMERGNDKWQQAGSRRADRYEQTPDTEKSFTLTANWHKGVPYNYFKDDTSRLHKPKQVGVAAEINALTTGLTKDHNISLETQNEMRWRKLTPIEAERLQTVDDNYTAHVSNSRRYHMLGNGWTIEIICHILKNMVIVEQGGEVEDRKGQIGFEF